MPPLGLLLYAGVGMLGPAFFYLADLSVTMWHGAVGAAGWWMGGVAVILLAATFVTAAGGGRLRRAERLAGERGTE